MMEQETKLSLAVTYVILIQWHMKEVVFFILLLTVILCCFLMHLYALYSASFTQCLCAI